MFQLSTTMGRRNHFHIFLSLSVNSEKELAKFYCVPRLYLQKKFTSLKFHHAHKPWIVFLHQEKCPCQIFNPPLRLEKQYSCYDPIKTSFLAAAVVPVPFLFQFHTGHTNFGFTDVQYLQNGVFSIENSLNGQNYSLTDFHHPIKNSLPSPNFPFFRWGIFLSTAFFTFQSRGVEIFFTHFFSFTVNWDSV